MQDSDDIYKKTKLDLLEEKIKLLVEKLNKMEQRNRELESELERKKNVNGVDINSDKKEKIRSKVGEIIEKIDSVL